MTITRRLLLLGSSALRDACEPAPAARWRRRAQTTKLTFVLVNDIYQMNEDTGPDGKKRGGFPRLATIVKAERAKAAQSGNRVIFAHAGDTLSPSLMSGIDRGYHIISLLNMIPPDIFVPGNHEFDFGKEIFLQRMKEAKFPLYAANMRDAKGAALPGFKDRTIFDVGGIKIGLTGAALTETRAALQFRRHEILAAGRLDAGAMQDVAQRRRRLCRDRGACAARSGHGFVPEPRRRPDPHRPRPRSVHRI